MKQKFLKLKVILMKQKFNKAKREAVKNFNLHLQEILDFRDVLNNLKIQDISLSYRLFPTDFKNQMAQKIEKFNNYITDSEAKGSFFESLCAMDYEECGLSSLLEKIEDKNFVNRYTNNIK